MLLNRYRRWKYALAAGRVSRAWQARPRPLRRLAGRVHPRDLAYLLRLERVALCAQMALGFALAAPAWDLADVRLLVLAIFCLGPCLYGGLYALNDTADAAADRLHPAKRRRPVASGRLSPILARWLGLALVTFGLGLALALDGRVFALGLTFALINVLYTHVFKHRRGLDLVFNMLTHPLRLAGGLWLGSDPSAPLVAGQALTHWPLLVVWSLAGLANCAVKRLYELRTAPPASRRVLRRYTEPGLLRLVAVCQGAALGLLPFLAGFDLGAAALALLWSIVLISGYRRPIGARLMQVMGR